MRVGARTHSDDTQTNKQDEDLQNACSPKIPQFHETTISGIANNIATKKPHALAAGTSQPK